MESLPENSRKNSISEGIEEMYLNVGMGSEGTTSAYKALCVQTTGSIFGVHIP